MIGYKIIKFHILIRTKISRFRINLPDDGKELCREKEQSLEQSRTDTSTSNDLFLYSAFVHQIFYIRLAFNTSIEAHLLALTSRFNLFYVLVKFSLIFLWKNTFLIRKKSFYKWRSLNMAANICIQ